MYCLLQNLYKIDFLLNSKNFSCNLGNLMVSFLLLNEITCRRVGMADDADSKSVGLTPVWVQVPLPALKSLEKSRDFFCASSEENRVLARKFDEHRNIWTKYALHSIKKSNQSDFFLTFL